MLGQSTRSQGRGWGLRSTRQVLTWRGGPSRLEGTAQAGPTQRHLATLHSSPRHGTLCGQDVSLLKRDGLHIPTLWDPPPSSGGSQEVAPQDTDSCPCLSLALTPSRGRWNQGSEVRTTCPHPPAA